MLLLTAALASPSPYDVAMASVDIDRLRLAQRPRAEARLAARERLTKAVRDELTPAWLGTPWAFHGTSTVPGTGTIACGYFVSTVLEDAGLRVERVRMAQQASEYIVKTFASPADVRRFRRGDEAAVVADTLTREDGLYVVGMDIHVGLLIKQGNTLEYCHSSYLGTAEVVCSNPLDDPGFVSNYHVVGPVLTDPVLDAWLEGQAIPTFLP